MNRYQEMRIFQALVSDLSLAAAARHLNISAPTVTRAMAALEQRLGTLLLQRSTRGVSLTAAGERFASDCQRILQEVNEAEASACGLHAEPRGQLHLAMPLLFGQQIMTSTLLDYLHAYPQVDIFAQYLDRFPNLHEEGIDVAVLMGALPDSSLFALKIGSIRRVVCASPAYLQRHGTALRPQELLNQQIIHSSADARLPEWRFQDQGSALNVSLRPRLTCTTNQAAIVAACRDGGLIRCMSYQVHELIEQGRLCRLLQAYELPPLPVYLAYREGRKAAARVRSFVDFAVSRLREHPALR
ncbi:MAG: LysR family transcriptional regulator [Pseudomonas sp.]|uniref:LysR family transcriptional regulator n=1 Tax=Pseudomonas sp. TaxID=306 RepID=UPI0027343B7D|nr:LysR family transcriptional regulator [Pseudomonas sp.]MDP3844884.1 LysR family transcriptional regulator [Pseudomonas sp.]